MKLGLGLGVNSITSQKIGGVGFTGILDEYSGAAAAYSVRRLSSSYTDGLIRVRRSSDDTEQDIGFDANGDLDTTALLAFVGTGGTDNGFVTTWYDQTGNGNDATNATASEQPLIVSGGTLVEENSKAAIDFDGVDDKLSFASNLNIGGSPSIIGVLNTAAGDIVWRGGGSDYWYFQASQILRYRNGDFDATWINSDGLPIVTGSQKLIATYKNSTSVELTVDGASIATKSSGTGREGFFNYIGSDAVNMDGVWQELIIYTSDQSTNRQDIEWNINNYYSIYEQWNRNSAMSVRRSSDDTTKQIGFDGSSNMSEAEVLSFVNEAGPVLDDYAGAAAAYSLRKVRTAYTGSAIKVRRSSDDGLQDIGFDSNGDLDTTALLAFVNAEYTLADEDFSSSTGWTLGTGVSITGGVMTANTSGTVVSYKNFGDTGAQQVRVTFTVSNYVSGSVRYMNFAVSTTGTSRSANGTYTEVLTLQEGGNANHGLQMLSNFVGDIDDFEVVQITADGAVTTFYDQTGNGNNATNATASEQPKIVSGGSVETLGSDVTPVRQGVTTTLDISGVESSVTGAFTLVTRFYLRSQSDSDCIFGGRGLTAGAGLCASYLSGAWRFEVVTTTGTRAIVVVSDSNTPINNWYNVIFTWDGTTDSNAVKVYLNTSSNIFTATANGTVINYDASYPMSIFNADRNSFDGGLATWTIFDSQVTDIDGLFTAITP